MAKMVACDADDFQGKRADPDFLSVATEQTRAYQTGTLASDIVAEQKKVERADLIILQFPECPQS